MSKISMQNKNVRALVSLLAAALFLLAYEYVVYRVPIWEIYQPATAWNDEVYYCNQLSAVMKYGAPQGYFGFNESHADIGTFSAWGPALFYIYAIPGLIFRGQNAMIWCNLFWVLVGWFVFVRGTEIGWRGQALFAVVMAAMNNPIRYAFSAMQEPLHYAFMLAAVGLGAWTKRTQKRAAWISLCVLCFAAGLARPYMAALWLIPLVLAWPRRRAVIGTLAGAAVCLLSTMILLKKFYAPYFFTNVDMEPLYRLAHGEALSAIRYVADKLFGALSSVWEDIATTLTGGSGGFYTIFFLLLLAVLICLIWDAVHKRPIRWKACAFCISAAIFLALMLMYRPTEAMRHTLILDVLLTASLALEDLRPTAAVAALCAVLSLTGVVDLTSAGDYSIPRYYEPFEEQIAELRAVLEESQSKFTGNDPWDRTFADSFCDDVLMVGLFALPDGMGLQFDEIPYLTDTSHEIKSRYMLTSHGSEVEKRLLDEGWTLLYDAELGVIYERCD